MRIHSPSSMGDVLPPKRQTVVDRLKRRIEHYRGHQNACLPRYEQSANGLYETQRQDTLLLKQRYLESKAKKAKNKSDHHRTYKEPTSDTSKAQLHKSSLKRSADDSTCNAAPTDTANNEDSEKPTKIQCTESSVSDTKPQKQELVTHAQVTQQQPLSTFSVQIVQQFSQRSQHNPSPQSNVTVKSLPKSLQSPMSRSPVPAQEPPPTKQEDNLQMQGTRNIAAGTFECKQEKDNVDSDLYQFKNNQASNGSGGDRLSDTFPSIEFTDESGETVLHPDILNDLIEDVFINSADIMKDFNFEDSVGSIKDASDSTKDIIDLVKGPSPQMRSFQSESLQFTNSPASSNTPNGMFSNLEEAPVVPISNASSPVTTSSSFYNPSTQRMPFNNANLPLPNGLGLDFKLTEPSPAALTLKQLAEQHQNMQQKQQQQLVSSPLSNRAQSFPQTTFSSHPIRTSNYINAPNPTMQSNSPKMMNPGTNVFSAFEQRMNNFSSSNETSNNFSTAAHCDTLNSNSLFGASRPSDVLSDSEVRAFQMKLVEQQQQQQKPPAYGVTRSLNHFADGGPNTVRHPSPVGGGQQHRSVDRQFQNNAGVRLQMSQVQQMQPRQHNAQEISQETHDIKHQQPQLSIIPQHSNIYSNFPSQQQQQSVSNPAAFHMSLAQSLTYSTNFSNSANAINRPPPEYKAAHHRSPSSSNLNLVDQMFNQPQQPPIKNKFTTKQQHRPPNVTITPDGDWRNNLLTNQFRISPFQQHQDSYPELSTTIPVSPNIPLSPIYSQYRLPASANRPMVKVSMPGPAQRQRMPMPQRLRHPSTISLEQQQQHSSINSGISVPHANMMGPIYSAHQDLDRQDGGHLSLDFLDNIESSASDLLNFDQVMQGGQSFPNLDDILGK